MKSDLINLKDFKTVNEIIVEAAFQIIAVPYKLVVSVIMILICMVAYLIFGLIWAVSVKTGHNQ